MNYDMDIIISVKVVLSLIMNYICTYLYTTLAKSCCVIALYIKNNELLQIFTELCHSKLLWVTALRDVGKRLKNAA